MSTSQATRALFQAINNYSSHPDFPDAARDEAALRDMREALRQGADWKEPLGPGQRDAAFAAATCADRAPLALLLEHGVPLDHQPGSDGMLIHRAAEFGRVDVVRMLVERGVAVDVRDKSNRTPLSYARAWRHGARAVPVLISLMQEQGCTPGKPRRGDDLLAGTVRDAVSELGPQLPPPTRAALERSVAAFFTEYAGGKTSDFLLELAEQSDSELLAAGVRVVQRASTKEPRAKTVKSKRLTLAHHGDLEVAGDCNAITLVVTGNLTVRGLLTNHEGCIVCVGGDLKTDAAWSEGPLWVGGNLHAETVFCGAYNDYGTTVRGALETAALVQLDHSIQAGHLRAGQHFRAREEVPQPLATTLAAALKIKKL